MLSTARHILLMNIPALVLNDSPDPAQIPLIGVRKAPVEILRAELRTEYNVLFP